MKSVMLKIVLLGALVLCLTTAPSYAVTELPDPTTVIYDDYNNPIALIASQHDDFYSYSADLLRQLGYSGFDDSVGTGVLSKDILIYTGATGQDNLGLPGGNFPNPLQVPSGTDPFYSGTWGATGAYTPISVNQVLTYLHSFDSSVNIPVFNFDMNQTGEDPNILVSGRVQIWDPTANGGLGGEVAFWAFDDLLNNAFDPTAMVLAAGDIDLGVDQCLDKNGKIETCYTLNNNRGSGSLDFIAYAPTMDLSLYADKGYEFRADFYIGNPTGGFAALNNGFEELYMTGAYAPTTVPEPATLFLLGGGLLGGAFVRRRKRS